MKKSLLSLFVMLAFVSLTQAQTTYVDFETNASPTGYVFGGNGYEPGVDNPNTTGNTSAKVGMATTGNETWSGMAMPIGGTIGFSASDTSFTMDILSSVTGPVLMKLENAANTAQFFEVSADYTTADAWQTLTYNFPDTLEAGVYSQIVLFFNFGATDSTAWYFDNIVGPEATFSDDVVVNIKIDDKLEIASNVGLTIEGEDISLSQDGNLYTSEKVLSPYKISTGGGEYEAIIFVDEAELDTATITVSGASDTMDWNYIILVEEPEDGTALAISVGDTPPTIDGEIDEVWSNAKVHPLQQRAWWGSATGLYSYYKIMWDIDNLYVLNYVDDKTPVNNGEFPYENDNIELFFDMNQSASAGYDADDWQIRLVRGLDTWTGSANAEAADWSNAQRAQKALADDAGYVAEWALPWTTLSSAFLPLVDSKFNFDVVIADVADAAGRDYIIAWNTYLDQNYNNTELFGTVTLSALTSEVATGIRSYEEVKFNVYPNPATEFVSISAKSKISAVKIYDITGKIVSTQIDVNSNVLNVNTNNLRTGIYFIQVTDIKGNSTAQKLRIY